MKLLPICEYRRGAMERLAMLVVWLLSLTALVWAESEPPYPIPPDLKPPSLDLSRFERFPSVQERVKVYMSSWYTPPCESYHAGKIKYRFQNSATDNWRRLWIQEPRDRLNGTSYVMESIVGPDKAFFVDRGTILDCTNLESTDERYVGRFIEKRLMRKYCHDAATTLFTALEHIAWELGIDDPFQMHPLLLQFGDNRYSHVYRYMDVPLIKKFRSATTPDELARVTNDTHCLGSRRRITWSPHQQATLQPIVWKLATSRHFGLLDNVYRDDTPWEKKTNMAVFRGQLTGSRDGFDKRQTPEENCLRLRRCRLAYRHANSTLVHAKLTNTRGRLPDELNGIQLTAPSVTLDKLLQFKGIIMLEGNDVASGLKWALLSQSVVLMPVPKHTSWAMEELLQPWVHYVPLNDGATDVEEKMQWIIDHDDFARRIAERGSQWMQDMVYHPDAMEEDRLIQEEILRRYFTHFQAV